MPIVGGSSPFLVCSRSCGQGIEVEVEAAGVEEDGVRESFPVAKTAAAESRARAPAGTVLACSFPGWRRSWHTAISVIDSVEKLIVRVARRSRHPRAASRVLGQP